MKTELLLNINNTNFILSQIFGGIALVFAFFALQFKNKNVLLFAQTISCFAYSLSYLFVGSSFGFCISIIGTIRFLLFYFLGKKEEKPNLWALLIINILFVSSFFFIYENLYSIILLCGTLFYTYGCWQKNDIVLRLSAINISIVYLIYNAMYQNYIGVIMEVLLIISACLYIIKVANKNKVKLFRKNKKLCLNTCSTKI